MLSEPRIEQRDELRYAAIPARATTVTIPTELPPLIPEVFGWLAEQGVAPAGPPFFRYLVIDMAGDLDVEVGVPVATQVTANGRVLAGSFPAGRYATAVHTGPYDELGDATRQLLAWAKESGVVFQVRETEAAGDTWAGRAEFYLTSPDEEPDPQRWLTELAFLVAEAGI